MAIICQCCSSFIAFQISNEARCKTSRQTQIYSNSKDDINYDNKSMMTLNFVGDTIITSKVAAIDDNKSLLELSKMLYHCVYGDVVNGYRNT